MKVRWDLIEVLKLKAALCNCFHMVCIVLCCLL